jgi:nucleoid-associated protein YgaU
VTPIKKLFIAFLLLATGLGLAKLMGQPSYTDFAFKARPSAATPRSTTANPFAGAVSTRPQAVRLVPDFNSENPYQLQANGATTQQEPKTNVGTNVGNTDADPPPLVNDFEYQPIRELAAPRAQLRDEAPRALGFDSNARAMPATQPADPSPREFVSTVGQQAAPAASNTGALIQAQFVQESREARTINAPFMQPLGNSQSVPKPTPFPPSRDFVGESETRSHIVIDGDSLQRLAARYLKDPARANEIYEANRELLANPDLLPIGVELIIPRIERNGPFDSSDPQSSVAGDSPLRAARHPTLVPPKLAPVVVTPRAQLLPPMSATVNPVN